MANYEAPVLYNAVTTTFKTAGFLWAVGHRIMLYEIEMGQTAAYASTDAPVQWDLSRAATPSLAGSAVVTNALDPADPASASLFINAVTTEPTYTTAGNGLSLKSWGINQRGSYRWRALDDGDNIIVPNTGGNGVGLRCASIASGFAGSAIGNISFVER
jgi:hypothetical protein